MNVSYLSDSKMEDDILANLMYVEFGVSLALFYV